MTKDEIKNQPTLFEKKTDETEAEKVILFALGEFQTRGFQLIERELPLDRLRGAFKRAAESFGFEEFSDEKIAGILGKLGANVKKVPVYVAKHPFRIKVGEKLALNGLEIYKKEMENDEK